ncbi:hypothetical protein YM80_001837 [Salmonella enterica subsp. salamae]|nr:hypothetical protein [Salmonella enterica subsp. salamae]
MGINAGIKFFTSVIHHKPPALTTFIRCLQGTPLMPRKFSSCCITFRAVPLSMLLFALMQYHRTCHTFSKKSSSACLDR